MDFSIKKRLLQRSDSESDFDEDPQLVEPDDEEVVIKDARPLFNSWIPADRYYLSYIIFYFLGTIVLLPWFFFVTAEEYWMYKFRPLNGIAELNESGRSELQAKFTSYLTLAATGPSTLFLIINPIINQRISLHLRVGGSLGCMLFLFIVTTVLVKVNTDTWQENFFVLTMAIVVVINIASAILQSAVFGMVGKFPPRYIAGTVSGQALGGLMASVAQISALALGASPILSALVYFIMADLFIFMAILAYIFLSTTLFFKYYSQEGEFNYHSINRSSIKDRNDRQISSFSEAQSSSAPQISYSNIMKKIWVHGFALWFCFFVMFSVYPGLTVLVQPLTGNPSSIWNEVFFVPVVTFLLFSICDYSGRLFAGIIEWPQGSNSGWKVAAFSLIRAVFVPLVMLSNSQPRHHLPVILNNDLYYIALIIVFGLSNGYLANITFLSVPKLCEAHELEVASSIMAAFLGIGIFCGSVLNLAIISLT